MFKLQGKKVEDGKILLDQGSEIQIEGGDLICLLQVDVIQWLLTTNKNIMTIYCVNICNKSVKYW